MHIAWTISLLTFCALTFGTTSGQVEQLRGRLRSRGHHPSTTLSTTENVPAKSISHRQRERPTTVGSIIDGPKSRLRRPPGRTTPMPMPIPQVTSEAEATLLSNHNSNPKEYLDLDRKVTIEQLCHRKYASSSTEKTTTSTSTPTTSTSTLPSADDPTGDRAQPQKILRRSRLRVPRRVVNQFSRLVTTEASATTTTSLKTVALPSRSNSEPICKDFDHLTDEQLGKRLKGGKRRKPQMSI